ncbi:hypothetical protein [Streptomyces sp. HPF1205]|uniref:hypothetical protein n=1 Tax=Streptomyces sp. HPF1205 TaxID=2873262 RepID=UPI001CED68E1|nr:hypothetical protein [Streptomyces sp. HPF1205]
MTHTPTRAGRPEANTPPGPGTRPGRNRRGPWRETSDRVRGAAGTEPGRLRIIGAVLAVLVVAFGAVTAWQVTDRSDAAGNVLHHSGPLSSDAAEIYRSLADADATVTGGFLVGGEEPAKVTDRYETDIKRAARLITEAAASSRGAAADTTALSHLSEQLPYYTRLVATAQADNRLGFPLGGAYLRYANQQMRQKGGLLDSADTLYRAETRRLDHDYARAKALPWGAWVLGVLALAVLAWAQRRHYRRTNRVFNQGMLAATAAASVVLVWLLTAHMVARGDLGDSYAHGAKSMRVLNNARIAVLQARGDENLTLVARGSGDSYDASFVKGMQTLAGTDPKGVGGEMAQALALADTDAGRAPVKDAIKGVQTWRARHADERRSDNGGDYTTAVAHVIGGKDAAGDTVTETTGQCFDKVDQDLEKAVAQEQSEFTSAARSGHGALSLLAFGAGLLAVLAAAGAVLGIGRRLSEYR